MKKILLVILGIIPLLTLFVVLLNYEKWQEGYYPHEWLESGMEEVDDVLEYDDIMNYILVETINEDKCITYHYLITTYKEYTSDLIGDIDIYYMEKNDIDIYITFKIDNCFWNKLACNGTVGLKPEYRKFTYCEDYDIVIEIKK